MQFSSFKSLSAILLVIITFSACNDLSPRFCFDQESCDIKGINGEKIKHLSISSDDYSRDSLIKDTIFQNPADAFNMCKVYDYRKRFHLNKVQRIHVVVETAETSVPEYININKEDLGKSVINGFVPIK